MAVTAGNVTDRALLNATAETLSQDTCVLYFGLAASHTADVRIEIPVGDVHLSEGVAADQRLVLYPDESLLPVDEACAGRLACSRQKELVDDS